MPRVRIDRQTIKVPCTRCGKEYSKMLAGSSDISSFRFPQYMIQRYRDFDSPPREINLCEECCDKLDRFLYIYTEGQDYYINEENLMNEGEKSNEC